MSFNYHANPEERALLIAGLYDLAIFLKGNPEVPVLRCLTVWAFPPKGVSEAKRRAEVDSVAALIAAEVSAPDGYYQASRHFGPVEYRIVAIPSDNGEGE